MRKLVLYSGGVLLLAGGLWLWPKQASVQLSSVALNRSAITEESAKKITSDAITWLSSQPVTRKSTKTVSLAALNGAEFSGYRTELDHYLKSDLGPKENRASEEEARGLVVTLRQSLAKSGLSSDEAEGVVKQLGKHFYNRALIGFRDGESRAEKIRYLKLAIAHLGRGKR